MLKKFQAGKFIRNNRGMLSADFIFSLVLAFGLSAVLFAMSFTFSMAEVSQYVVFSAARAYSAGHLDSKDQVEMGRAKFAELLKNSDLAPLLGSADSPWFHLTSLELKGGNNAGDSFSEYAGYKERIPFVGARAEFVTKLLSLKLPLLGRTDPEGNGFTAKLTAFLIREPTQDECWRLQIKERYKVIMELDSKRYAGSGTTEAANAVGKYIPMEDNGC